MNEQKKIGREFLNIEQYTLTQHIKKERYHYHQRRRFCRVVRY